MYIAGRRAFIGPMYGVGKSNLIILICITKRIDGGIDLISAMYNIKKSRPCKPKIYHKKDKLCKFNTFHSKRKSYAL